MGVQRGGGGKGPAKNGMFLDFFEKNSMFFVVFKAKSMFLSPDGKKTADALDKIYTLLSH